MLLLLYPAWSSGTVTPAEPPYYQPFGGPKSEYFDWTPYKKKAKRIERERLNRELALFLLMME
jgi:hypothetical protein